MEKKFNSKWNISGKGSTDFKWTRFSTTFGVYLTFISVLIHSVQLKQYKQSVQHEARVYTACVPNTSTSFVAAGCRRWSSTSVLLLNPPAGGLGMCFFQGSWKKTWCPALVFLSHWQPCWVGKKTIQVLTGWFCSVRLKCVHMSASYLETFSTSSEPFFLCQNQLQGSLSRKPFTHTHTPTPTYTIGLDRRCEDTKDV